MLIIPYDRVEPANEFKTTIYSSMLDTWDVTPKNFTFLYKYAGNEEEIWCTKFIFHDVKFNFKLHIFTNRTKFCKLYFLGQSKRNIL